MTDKTYIRILEDYIFSQGNTKADLMAFIINQINLPKPKPKNKRRTRKFKR